MSADEEEKEAAIRMYPSTLGAFYYTHCEKFLLLRALARRDAAVEERMGGMALGGGGAGNALLDEVLEQGNEFEERYRAWLEERAKERPEEHGYVDATGADGAGAVAEAARRVTDPAGPATVHVYHPRLAPPEGALATLLSTLELDFLRVERGTGGGAAVLTVMDAKASRAVKLAHQMQVALYSHVLALVVSPELARVSSRGEVVLPVSRGDSNCGGDSAVGVVEPFRLRPLRPLLHNLLDEVLPRVSRATAAVPAGGSPAPDAAEWRLASESCRSCDFLARCRRDARGTLNEVPYLSGGAFRRLRHENGGRVGDVEDLLRRGGGEGTVAPAEREAVLERRVTVRPGARAALAAREDFAVVVSLFADPRSGLPFAWAVDVRASPNPDFEEAELAPAVAGSLCTAGEAPPQPGGTAACAEALVAHLATVIRALESTGATVQFYAFAPGDVASLEALLLGVVRRAAAERPERAADAQLCLFQLAHSTDVLGAADAVKPPDRYGAFVDTVTRLSVAAMRARAADYGVAGAAGMTKAQLAPLLRDAVARRAANSPASCPHRLVSVLEAVRHALVLPVPGFYTLADCVGHLVVDDDADGGAAAAAAVDARHAFDAWRGGGGGGGGAAVVASRRCDVVWAVLEAVRARVPPDALVVRPWPLKPVPPLGLSTPEVRGLVFMKHAEASASWLALQRERLTYAADQSRLDGKSLRLEFVEEAEAGGEGKWRQPRALFRVLAGAEYLEADEDRRLELYKWIVHADTDEGRLAAAHFSDVKALRWSTYQGAKGLGAPPEIRVAGFFAVERPADGREAAATLQFPWRLPKGFLAPGRRYVARRRATDFTTGNVTKHLYELDAAATAAAAAGRGPPGFVALLRDPVAWGRVEEGDAASGEWSRTMRPWVEGGTTHYLEQKRLGVEGARDLCFNRSQSAVLNALVPPRGRPESRLLCVWGPPGTGKTQTLALTLLRLMKAAARAGRECFHALVVGYTHKAIDNVLDRARRLAERMRQIDGGGGWLDRLRVCGAPESNAADPLAQFDEPDRTFALVGATTYRCAHFRKSTVFDMLLVDEASQMPVAEMLLAFERLRPGSGRLVVAGDHMQLPPILRHAYPRVAEGGGDGGGGGGGPPLYGSVLHCLLRDDRNRAVPLDGGDTLEATSRACALVTLRENYRMNAPLTRFAQVIYGPEFCQDDAAGDLRLDAAPGSGFGGAVDAALEPGAPIATVVLRPRCGREAARCWSYDEQVGAEAHVVARMVLALHGRGAVLPTAAAAGGGGGGGGGTFVVTPHHVQKAAVRALLPPELHERVDTVDKIQGQEADTVIVAYAFMDLDRLNAEKHFIFSRPRLNVAVTRARKKCVLVCSEEVLDPPASVYADEPVRDGILHLLAWKEACEDRSRGDAGMVAVAVDRDMSL